MAQKLGPIQAVIGLTGLEAQSGGLGIVMERFARVRLPERISSEDVEVMRRDLEILAETAKEHRDRFAELQNSVLDHDLPTARRIADELGLTEEKIAARGGGQWKIIITTAVMVYLLTSGEPEPAPRPPHGSYDV
jgi:hypothetical protein